MLASFRCQFLPPFSVIEQKLDGSYFLQRGLVLCRVGKNLRTNGNSSIPIAVPRICVEKGVQEVNCGEN